MKKLFFLLLLFTGIANGQIVNIPDANFKTHLLSANAGNQIAKYIAGTYGPIDTNGDGQIQNTEALQIAELNISASGITSVSGIESFSNLTVFYTSSLQVTTLDVTILTQLQKFRCISAPNVTNINLSGLVNIIDVVCLQDATLTSINLSGDVNLQSLNCESNNIVSLDISNLTNLVTVFCDDNPLNSLNVQGCVSLNNLQIDGNSLTTLDISGCTGMVGFNSSTGLDNSLTTVIATGCTSLTSFTVSSHANLTFADFSGCGALTNLDLSGNSLTSLNLSGCSELINLDVSGNALTALDLSAFHHLNTLNAFLSSLETLSLKNGSIETNVSLIGNPALQFICADEGDIEYLSGLMGLNGVVINSYCDFTPGGDFNTIRGTVRLDTDNDGCDVGDIVPTNTRINMTDGTNLTATFVNGLGNYTFYSAQTGNFMLTPILESPQYFNVSPSSPTLSLPLIDNSVQTQDFCLTANGNHPDMEIVMYSPVARPGFNSRYYIVYKNKGNQAFSGSVNSLFDDARTDFISALPSIDNQSTGNLTWNFTNLNPFETRTIEIVLNINSSDEDPPVNVGDHLNFTASIEIPPGDETTTDNVFNFSQLVVNSFDPNDKTCLEGENVTVANVGKYLHYNINFENTGTSDAVNVVVKDVIDTTKFDINTLQLIYASSPAYSRITGNVAEFIFENINLPPSSINPIGGHGNVLFKIKTLEGLPAGTQVSNTAGIYFDYNAPIATNEARTTFTALSKMDFSKDNSISIYPNPSKNLINIKANSDIKSVQLFDIEGRILQTFTGNKNAAVLDISNQQNGIYLLKVITAQGSTTEQIIKE